MFTNYAHEIIRLIVAISIFYTLCHSAVKSYAVTREDPQVAASFPIQISTPPAKARESALKGKKRLERLAVTDKYAQELGFDSRSQAGDSNTKLGDPFLVIILNFKMLKDYDPKVDPTGLFIFLERFIFPVVASGQVKSSVTVELKDSTKSWKPVEWGSKGLIRLLVKARSASGSGDTSFLVWIPQLSRYFLGDIRKSQLLLIPLYDEKDYGFVAGVPKSAVEVFKIIAVEANNLPIAKP
jgi:hypothetical protein